MPEIAPLLASSFAYIFAGFIVGLVVGLTGVGGGSLMTPLLIFGFGIKPHLAIGTDLLFAAFTKLGGTVSLARHRLIDWRVVGQMALGSVPACLVTLYILKQLGPANPATQGIMTTTLGVALLLTAVATLLKAVRGKTVPTHIAAEHLSQATTARHWALPVLFGAIIGTLVTITSVGAGAIGVIVLMLLYPALPLPRIVAGRHCPRCTSDAGGWPGSRINWLGRLVAAGWLAARYLAGNGAHEKKPRPDHPLAFVRLAGLRRTQIDCHLI